MVKAPKRLLLWRATGNGAFAKIAQNTGWLLSSKGLGAVLSLFYLAITTRTLGPAGFGVFSLVIAASQFIARMVTFDSWQAVVKYGQAPLRDGDSHTLALLVSATLTIDVLSAVAGVAVAAGIALGLGSWLGWDQSTAWMGLGYATVVLLALRSTGVGILRLMDRFAAAALAESMMPIMRMIGVLVAWFSQPTVLGFLAVWALSETVVSMTYWILAYRHGRGQIGRLRPVWPNEAQRHFPGILAFLMASNVNLSLITIINNLPIFVVGSVVGTAEAGYYRLAAQLGNALTTFSQLMSRAIFAEATRSHVRTGEGSRVAEMRALLYQISTVSILSAVIIVTILWGAGEWLLLQMSGPAYLPAYILLLLLGSAAAIEMAGVSFDPLLTTIGRQRLSVLVRVVEMILLGMFLALLLPDFAAKGAAIAVLLAAFAGFTLRGIALARHLR